LNTVDDLLSAMDGAGLRFEDALYGAGVEAMEVSGDGEWSIKDLIGHIATWNEVLLSALDGRGDLSQFGVPEGNPPVLETDILNAEGVSRSSGMSLDHVWDRYDESRTLLRERLAGIDPALLGVPLSELAPDSPFADDATLGEWFRQVTATHLEEHRPRILQLVAEQTRQATVAEEIARLDRSYARLASVADERVGRDDGRRDEGGWNVADNFLHIAAWNQELIALIRKEPVAQSVGVPEEIWERGDEAEINEAIHQRNRGASAAAAWNILMESVRDLRAALSMLEDDDLQRTRAEFGSDGRMGELPLIRWVRSCGALHPEGHLPAIALLLESASES
jgi:hypothetical protein